jgi:hypothetical protein
MPRTEPSETKELYKALGDLIRIFWEFHKLRVRNTDILPAYRAGKMDIPTPFSLETEINAIFATSTTSSRLPLDVFKLYSNGLARSTKESWFQFSSACGGTISPDYRPFTESLPKQYEPFTTEYAIDVFERAQHFTNEGAGNFLKVEDNIAGGLENALQFSVQLAAVSYALGDKFDSAGCLLLLSQIHLLKIPQARKYVGLPNNLGVFLRIRPVFELYDPEQTRGINMAALEALGHKRSNGCPAAMQESEECRIYLQDFCGVKPQRNIVLDLFEYVRDGFRKDVVNWYEGLGSLQKRMFINKYNLEILEGKIPITKGTPKRMDFLP